MNNKELCKVYIADCCDEGGVYCYSLLDSLKLVQKNFTPIKSPMFLNVRGDKLDVVLRREDQFDGDSATVTYIIDNDGGLHLPTNLKSTYGKIGCHICSFNDDVYTANYISGSISKQGDRAVQHYGFGPNAVRQDAAHCHFVYPSPDNKYLLAVDLGNDTIYTYDFDLQEIAFAKVPLGHGCRHLAYSNGGKYVFCVNELASTVSAFEYNNGTLTLLDTYSALPDDFNGSNTAAAIRVSGNYLYVSNRGHNSIVKFKINNGKLNLLSFTHCGGESPRDFNIIKDVLVCANESGEVTLFKLDNINVEEIECDVKLKHPLCVVFK